MDNANGPNIVADIAHISKVAEGTFICHEDPTCFEQSRALYDMHKHYSAARQYIHPSPKPANQIIHPTLIDCENGSNELIYATINYKFMHESVPEVSMLIFCGICIHMICACVNPLYSIENGNEESSREGKFDNLLYRSMWDKIFYCLGLV